MMRDGLRAFCVMEAYILRLRQLRQMLFQESVEYPKCKTITDKYDHCDEYSYAGSGLKSAPEGNKNQRDNNARQCKNIKRFEQCPQLHVVCQ